jgi:ribosomal protein S18 acetylase RimI-like enzyme
VIEVKLSIRTAIPADAAALPAIESSAGMRFLSIPDLAWLAWEEDVPAQTHRRYIDQGTEWVAVGDGQDIVGFLAAEIVSDDLHVWEIAVRQQNQRRGIGRCLLAAAERFAWERGLASLTLTTFLDVPWNAPWYKRRGFTISSDDERLSSLVSAERERGWPRRCAMRKTLRAAWCSEAVPA